eukprot:2200369-Lingulodinium_polyedra.AAC.1
MDWMAGLIEGIHFRYSCPWRNAMPRKSCDFWRLSNEERLNGVEQNGCWAAVCGGGARGGP